MKYFQTFMLTLICIAATYSQSEHVSQDIKMNSYVYGSLLKPSGAVSSLVIIIPGSGPTDRNGNQQMMRNNSLKKLAEGLADKGIASFRYDKRVLTLLKQRALREDKMRFDDFIEDAVTIIRYFKDKGTYEKIFILGHSQGSLVGMIAAQQEPVDGYISLAGAGQSIDQTIISQIALQMPDLKESAIASFAALRENGNVDDYSPALASVFRKPTQPFMASWMKYNPAAEIKKTDVPTLIVNGTKDIQTNELEAEALKNAKQEATLVLIENMNHVLRIIEGGDLENTKSYTEAGGAISSELVTTISDFVKKH